MVVFKKSGEEEKFSYEKLACSVRSANEDTGETLDLELLSAEFQNITMDKEDITTGQINVIVYGLLYAKNVPHTLKNYAEYKKYD